MLTHYTSCHHQLRCLSVLRSSETEPAKTPCRLHLAIRVSHGPHESQQCIMATTTVVFETNLFNILNLANFLAILTDNKNFNNDTIISIIPIICVYVVQTIKTMYLTIVSYCITIATQEMGKTLVFNLYTV